jgi:hypothetical protein
LTIGTGCCGQRRGIGSAALALAANVRVVALEMTRGQITAKE